MKKRTVKQIFYKGEWITLEDLDREDRLFLVKLHPELTICFKKKDLIGHKSSHLSTIIQRVKNKVDSYGEDKDGLVKDNLFKQAVWNLKEYQEAWDDYTLEEKKEADALYWKHIDKIGGQRE